MSILRMAVVALALAVPAATAWADGCYMCGGSSSCKQCSYGSKDTFDARKACEKKGCKISGTASCSTAANVKSCALPGPGPSTAAQDGIPWCIAG